MVLYLALLCFFLPYRSEYDNLVWIASLSHLFLIIYFGQLYSFQRDGGISAKFVSGMLIGAC